MGKIQRLDERIIDKIAAGEVVERPASVVKELVENALDAGARRVDVHVEEGGLARITVRDDGEGMDRDDCRRAFERHATSKLARERDLFRIRTLGFRGEALPSIAAVSRVVLTSAPRGAAVGTRVTVEGGRVMAVEDAPARGGTEVTVRDLFYNTPARLKHLKTVHTELGHITDYVTRFALARPDVAFAYTHNGNRLLATPGDGELLHAAAAVYGHQTAKHLVPLRAESLDYRLTGLVGRPEVSRATRGYISVFVNGRYVKNPSLLRAVLDGYRTLLPVHRYPIAILHLEMDPELVDVNVHPSKVEVRFGKEEELLALVRDAIGDALAGEALIPTPTKPARSVQPRAEQMAMRLATLDAARRVGADVAREAAALFASADSPSAVASPPSATGPLPDDSGTPPDRDPPKPVPQPSAGTEKPLPRAAKAGPQPTMPRDTAPAEPDASGPTRPFPELHLIGQLHGTYILAQNPDGLFLIDQHAAQERIWFEAILRAYAEEPLRVQPLLVPLTVDLPPGEAEVLRQRLDELRRLGLDVEPFGLHAFVIRAHPHWFPRGEESEWVDHLVRLVLRHPRVDETALRQHLAASRACKAAIKANRYLTHQEMEALLADLARCRMPFTCPHGRPVIVQVTTYELEKWFKRVM